MIKTNLAYSNEIENHPVFQAFYGELHNEFFSYALRHLKNYEDAEDVMANIGLKFANGLTEKFETGRKIRPWLFVVVEYECLNLDRRKKVRRMFSLNNFLRDEKSKTYEGFRGDTPSYNKEDTTITTPQEIILKKEQKRKIRKRISDLEDVFKEVLELRYYKNLTYLEIAKLLGIPEGTIKSRLNSARNKIRKKLSRDKDFEEYLPHTKS